MVKIHKLSCRCTLETQLKSFYFIIVHNVFTLNAFLSKLEKIDSPLCAFCKRFTETLKHFVTVGM